MVVGHHALLFSLLVVTSFCDLDHREIPLSVTGWGTVAGLAFAIACPWPWPHTVSEALAGMPQGLPWWLLSPTVGPRFGLYPWPVWGPLPDWLSPGDPWTTGLATGLAGLLVGSILVRSIRFLFSVGLGVEALGLGDADILMMAGAFLGWQPAVIAFFLAVFPAVVLGIGQLIVRGEHAVPFGPSLAVGILGAMLGWAWIAPAVQVLFFNGLLLLVLALLSGTFLFLSGLGLGLMRKMRE
ncbi:MAG: A24 family peptidase [Gemmataceae bacterium]|nr:A24 family peptidase [Gemmataceae bacterium]